MKIKYEQLNNEAFCGKVPLNQTNLVQPHGVLLIVSPDAMDILQVSNNCEAVFGLPEADVAGKSLADFISADDIALLKERFTQPIDGKLPLQLHFNRHGVFKKFVALVQLQPQFFLMEIELQEDKEEHSFNAVYQDLKYIMSSIESATTVEEAVQVVAEELKRISGFDKVMIYQFDADWHGTVIAEAMEAGMDPYLGLKFPSSDIPPQAREMYRKNPYRYIPDVSYTPARLYPVLNPVTGGFTDLTDSNLRSVAGVHLEYLRNMKVSASMSTRIINEGRLWGLIACHHRTPRFLPYQVCAMFELLSSVISTKITSLQQVAISRYQMEMHNEYMAIVEAVFTHNDLMEGLSNSKHGVLKMLGADGIAVASTYNLLRFGTTPDEESIHDLIFWIQTNDYKGLYHTATLSDAYEKAIAYATEASGLLSLPISNERGMYVLAFRKAATQKVAWGGNPAEAVTFENDGKMYHPRNSFALWQQKLENAAIPWQETELIVAERFRNFLIDYTLQNI